MNPIEAILAVAAKLAGENEAQTGQNNTTINKFYKNAGYLGAPYCALYIAYCMIQAGFDYLAKCVGVAGVGNLARFCEAQGWRRSTPTRGDIAVEGDNQHVVFVWKVLGGGMMIVLEGNGGHVRATEAEAMNGTGATFEGIGYRKTSTSNFKFYHYAEADIKETPPEPTLSRTDYVKEFQAWLGTEADGDPQSKTAMAILAKMVGVLLKKYPVKAGDSGDMVTILQGLLYCLGYDPMGVDGVFGGDTGSALEKYQKARGLDVDRVAGADTFAAMLEDLTK